MGSPQRPSGLILPPQGYDSLEAAADDAWRLYPDLFAERMSGGRWRTAPHLHLIARALMECMAGRIRRLLVMMPPRHGKSELISRWAPLWMLSLQPWMQIILTSYGTNFSRQHSRWVRNTMRTTVGPQVGLSLDPSSRRADEWNLVQGGGVFATGIGGELTGRGAHALIVDDPVRGFADANSEVMRERAWNWWEYDAVTRIDPQVGFAVVLQTRWHEADLAGKLLEAHETGTGERWHVLRLPMIAEMDEDWGFWQRARGEALWPSMRSQEFAEQMRATRLPSVWAGLFQQRPSPAAGVIWRRAWYADGRQRFDLDDRELSTFSAGRIISVDTALQDKSDSAYTVLAVMDLTADYHAAVREVVRERITFPNLPGKITELARKWNYDGKLVAVVIEDKASGTSVIQTLRSAAGEDWLAELITPYQPKYDKAVRGEMAAVWGRNGMVLLPHPHQRAPWLHALEAELFAAPSTAYLDQFDAINQGVLYMEHQLRAGWIAKGRLVPLENRDDDYYLFEAEAA